MRGVNRLRAIGDGELSASGGDLGGQTPGRLAIAGARGERGAGEAVDAPGLAVRS